MKVWLDEYWFASILALLFVVASVGMLYIPLPAAKANTLPEPMATATPENPCAEWGLAGAQIIFKCIDEEPPYAVCYVPVGGVMQCVKD